jgi:molybdopterin molybdotransferase
MLDFRDAQKKIVDAARACEFLSAGLQTVERRALVRAVGRVLAEEVVSPIDVPTNDYSAMDGYAVATADFLSAEPVTLPMVGECQTGHRGVEVRPGTCARIFTGAHIPPGADAVVMQENTERRGENVVFKVQPKPLEHIRRAGEDLKTGEAVLSVGTRLTGFQLGLLATVERTEVLVAVRPRVMILCTGDELRPPGYTLGEKQLAESNSVALVALAQSAGADAIVGPIVTDNKELMKQALLAARNTSDVIITVGGVSVGDHDVVAAALVESGAEVIFHKVNIKPGKPVLFARWGGKFVLGLPGNPSSAQVTFALFGFPLLRALQGDKEPLPSARTAVLTRSFRQKPGRVGFYRGLLRGDEVEIFANQASGASTSIAWGNALVMLADDVTSVEAGQKVRVFAFADL